MKTLAHIGEPIEEHAEATATQTTKQPTDIGFYFFGGVVVLTLIGFAVWRFFKIKN